MVLELRILGPVEAVADGVTIDLGTAKERALLALLALNVGRVVPIDRLADELWEGEPPARADATLRVYVSHLRKALADATTDGEAIKTVRPGYVLDLTPEALDATRFDEICQRARSAASAGDHARAADLFREALALWRGPALADVADQSFARLEANRLEEARLAAIEERIGADLALGRHSELIGELELLTSEHPLRERLWAHKITALYRAGRQADALAAYRELRERLADELGIDPSPELQQLEKRVLAQDEALAPATKRTITRATNVPTYRTTFFGRAGEIDALERSLTAHQLVTLTGVGGCGKTRLAVEAARGFARGFSHGTFFVDFGSISDADLVVQTLAAGIEMAMGSLNARSTRPVQDEVADFLQGKRVLIVLDNCEHVLEAVAEAAESLLDASDELRIIATSREPLGVEGEQILTIPSLGLPTDETPADADSVRLFVDRAVASRADFRLAGDNVRAVADICRRLDGIPLAIELAAARVSHLSPRQIADRLNDRFRLLTGGRRRVPRQQTLQAAMDWSYDLLAEEERLFLRRLSVFPAQFSLNAAERVAAHDLSTTTIDLLGSLVSKSLLTLIEDDSHVGYRLPETVRAYAEERLADAGEGDAARTDHLDYVLEWLAGRPEEYRTFNIITADLNREAPNLLAALAWADVSGKPEAIATILASTRMLWAFLGGWDSGVNMYERALAIEESLSRPDRILVLGQAAGMCFFLGRYDQAVEYSTRAVQLGRDEDEIPFVEALFIHASLIATPDPEVAREHLDHALRIAESLGPAAIATVNSQYAEASMIWGEYASARERYATAAAQPPTYYTSHWGRFGKTLACHLLGEHDDALVASNEAMSFSEGWNDQMVGHAEPFINFMTKFAHTVALAGNERFEEARSTIRSLIADMDRRRIPGGTETALTALATVVFREGDTEGASRLLGKSGSDLRCLSAMAIRNHYVRLVREALGQERARKCRAEGQAMSLDEALAYGLGD